VGDYVPIPNFEPSSLILENCHSAVETQLADTGPTSAVLKRQDTSHNAYFFEANVMDYLGHASRPQVPKGHHFSIFYLPPDHRYYSTEEKKEQNRKKENEIEMWELPFRCLG
jgi:hypothetical protein